MFNTESIRGPGMIFLQILRAFTLIGLAAAVVACWILIIKVDTSRDFWFFDAASLFFTSSACVFLAISELPLARAYFRRTWPVLSDDHGLTWLGLAMTLVGCNILGKLYHPTNASKKLGLPWWRLVMAAGILSITFGIMNIISSFVFRDRANRINARQVRADGSLSKSRDDDSLNYSYQSDSIKGEKPKEAFMSFFWKKPEKSASKPSISHPMPREPDLERNSPPHHAHSAQESDDEWDQDRCSPIVPEIRRPDTALHPMHSRRSSRYSEAHMSRF